MRFLSQGSPVPILHAFLVSPLSPQALNKVHLDFQLGLYKTQGPADVNLVIHDEPRHYGATAEQLRVVLDAEHPDIDEFLLIDQDVEDSGAIWYVDTWKSDDEEEEVVQHGNERVLWKLRVMTKAVASRWVNYSIGNSSIQEDLSEVTTFPYDPRAPQTPYTVATTYELPSFIPPAYIVAGPDEFEEGPGSNLDVSPPQDRVFRLKESIARQHGLKNNWAIGWASNPDMAEVQGSMCFAQNYNMDQGVTGDQE
ncbi:hypothetical protein BKA64DRAFT_757450 [Cadophora sp. MPI-SDFR-AT-0126]|nr:hypothetical protein BKA64DRAFT_757450 [Leotiomycetes sp. MPI-SDFR-AT-0126]